MMTTITDIASSALNLDSTANVNSTTTQDSASVNGTPLSQYRTTYKAVLTPSQLDFFRSISKTHNAVLGFVKDLNESVVGVKLSAECDISDVRCHPIYPFRTEGI